MHESPDSKKISTDKIFKIISIVLVVFLGLIHLSETFMGDQALFTVYAKRINEGAVLYRDVWDLKQPGIFCFYLIAGKLFGFSEFGIHLFELLYWLAFAFVLLFTLRDYFQNQIFLSLAPLLTVGFYYAVSNSISFTQVESLVGFPLYLVLWFATRFLQKPDKKRLLFVAALCAGIVLAFKQAFLLILIFSFLSLSVYFFYDKENRKLKVAATFFGLTLLGVSLPVVIIIIYFWLNNLLDIVAYTSFEYPAKAIKTLTEENRFPILKESIKVFLKSYFPTIILTFIWMLACVKSLKDYSSKNGVEIFLREKKNFLLLNLFFWLAIGFVVVLVQRLSWWEYHFSLFFVPLGILAAKGIETLLANREEQNSLRGVSWKQIALLVCILVLFIPAIRRGVKKTFRALNPERVTANNKILSVKGDAVENYHIIAHEVAFLKEQSPDKRRIYVIGQPHYYYLSDIPPALSSNGWMPEFFLPDQWQKLRDELVTKKPRYFFIDNSIYDLIEKRSPETIALLKRDYVLLARNRLSNVYELK